MPPSPTPGSGLVVVAQTIATPRTELGWDVARSAVANREHDMVLGGPPTAVRVKNSALDDLDAHSLGASLGADLQDFFASEAWPPAGSIILRSKSVPEPSHALWLPSSRDPSGTERPSLIIFTHCDDDELDIEGVEPA